MNLSESHHSHSHMQMNGHHMGHPPQETRGSGTYEGHPVDLSSPRPNGHYGYPSMSSQPSGSHYRSHEPPSYENGMPVNISGCGKLSFFHFCTEIGESNCCKCIFFKRLLGWTKRYWVYPWNNTVFLVLTVHLYAKYFHSTNVLSRIYLYGLKWIESGIKSTSLSQAEQKGLWSD